MEEIRPPKVEEEVAERSKGEVDLKHPEGPTPTLLIRTGRIFLEASKNERQKDKKRS